MFRKGDLVVSGKNGVCKIVDVGEVDFLWAEKGRYYFILQPVYSPASKTYIPVDKAESLLRRGDVNLGVGRGETMGGDGG